MSKDKPKLLQSFDLVFEDDTENEKTALIHVYLNEKKLMKLATRAGLNQTKRARDGPLECRAYNVKFR